MGFFFVENDVFEVYYFRKLVRTDSRCVIVYRGRKYYRRGIELAGKKRMEKSFCGIVPVVLSRTRNSRNRERAGARRVSLDGAGSSVLRESGVAEK